MSISLPNLPSYIQLLSVLKEVLFQLSHVGSDGKKLERASSGFRRSKLRPLMTCTSVVNLTCDFINLRIEILLTIIKEY